ncbi:MAG: hypothetical protein R8N23_02070 [Reichenbachiella sp.]|uniref:hypothetical protein n=1 Tax=Reichenbachiella sp. TaxID=2184521 RepID=UPI0029676B8A|nr:hypothetical protein [Reichenbachiella sp.]MDW3208626.1 hypothetical protein [Reichenbachiella sp.]
MKRIFILLILGNIWACGNKKETVTSNPVNKQLDTIAKDSVLLNSKWINYKYEDSAYLQIVKIKFSEINEVDSESLEFVVNSQNLKSNVINSYSGIAQKYIDSLGNAELSEDEYGNAVFITEFIKQEDNCKFFISIGDKQYTDSSNIPNEGNHLEFFANYGCEKLNSDVERFESKGILRIFE